MVKLGDRWRTVVCGAVLVGIGGCSGGGSSSPDAGADAGADASIPCDDRNGEVFRLTDEPSMDEDGSIIVDDNGTIFFAFISDREGPDMDVWMTSSQDGTTWEDPWPVVATPDDRCRIDPP